MRFIELYFEHIRSDARRERLFLAWLSFLVTFTIVRAITHAIRAHVGPFHDLARGSEHVHHLVWGILLLLLVSYLWLMQIGTGLRDPGSPLSLCTAVLFGIGAALTLDEFALWLLFRDVYWEPQGRDSIDAVVAFGALLSVGWWGAPLFRAIGRELRHKVTRYGA